jgi:glutamate transport system permease protein
MSTNSVLFDVPGPKARVRHTIVALVASVLLLGVLGWVVVRLHDKGQLTAAKWTPFVTAEIWTQYLLPGIGGTLLAAAISVALASVLGLMLGLGRLSDNAAIRAVSGVVTEFFRAVPVLMMMLFSYALYSQYGLFPSEQLALAGVVTGLTLYNGTVMAELLRSGVGSLPNGQREAGLAIGLSGSQTRRSILVPQAITAMLPSLVSQLVVILKDTAFIVVAALFVLVNYSVSLLARMVEQRMRSRGRTAGTVAAAEVIAVGGTAGVAEAEATSTSHRSAS